MTSAPPVGFNTCHKDFNLACLGQLTYRSRGARSPSHRASAQPTIFLDNLFDPAPSVFEQKQELSLSQRRRTKTKSGIKTSRIFVDRMCQHRPNASLLGYQEGTPDSILQEPEADPSPLILSANRQTRQNDNRQGVLAHPFANTLRRIQDIDLTDCQTEVASDPIIIGHNKGLG